MPKASGQRDRKISMSRRSGQNGHIEKHNNNWRVRFWLDVVGQDKPKHMSVTLCPIHGPGALGASERQRKAREIIAASGADSVENFQKVEASRNGLTFRDQAARWITNGETRKRKPFKPATVNTYYCNLNKWLNPLLGDKPLASLDNLVMKEFVSKLTAEKLKPKTIAEIVAIAKQVVASAQDDRGNEMYPRKWNHSFIDLPVVKESEQFRPSVESPEVTSIIQKSDGQFQALYALLATSGMRIGEALAIRIEDDPQRTHLSVDCRTIHVVTSIWGGNEQAPKTENSPREIDLPSALAEYLKAYIGDRTSGWLFHTEDDTPLWPRNVARDSLTELGVPGFHVFRRFRLTNLREAGVPEDIIRFWMGHADRTITDRYSMMKRRVAVRKEWAEKVGLCFELPPSVPCVPQQEKVGTFAIAA
jgi:integrase